METTKQKPIMRKESKHNTKERHATIQGQRARKEIPTERTTKIPRKQSTKWQ